MAQHFAGSSEFANRYGALTNRQFVERIYQNVYGRAPDPSGHSYWTRQLDNGARSRGSVVLAFSEASEGIRKLQPQVDIALVWMGMMRTMPSAATFARWRSSLVGGTPLQTLIGQIRRSASYAERVT